MHIYPFPNKLYFFQREEIKDEMNNCCYGKRKINSQWIYLEEDGLRYADDKVEKLTIENCLLILNIFNTLEKTSY